MNIDYLLEYIKITVVSLEQDLEGLTEEMDSLDPASKDFADLDIEYNFISGQATGMRHIIDFIQKGKND
jgi:hypothetical protein